MIKDYRDSHTAVGKGKVYHSSFSDFQYRSLVWRWEQETMDKILQKYYKINAEHLDFACGTGRILNYLSKKSEFVTGIDISDSMLEIAKGNHPDLEIIKADITRNNILKNEKRSFSVITAFRFFLNAQDSLRKEVLKNLYPLLKEDGIFILNNHGNLTSSAIILGKLIVLLKNIFRSKEDRYTFKVLSEGHLIRIIQESGFEIIDSYHRTILPIINEKTSLNIKLFEKTEDFFSSIGLFRPFARNVMYVCRKTSNSTVPNGE